MPFEKKNHFELKSIEMSSVCNEYCQFCKCLCKQTQIGILKKKKKMICVEFYEPLLCVLTKNQQGTILPANVYFSKFDARVLFGGAKHSQEVLTGLKGSGHYW